MPGYELIGQEEAREVDEVFKNGGILFRHGFEKLRGDCFKVSEFEENFSKCLHIEYALAVTSGTAALRVALASLGIGPGDEVVTQCFTFVATVEAIVESGATPVCAEIDRTLNLDPISLKEKISSKTKAVIAVHMLGVPARLLEIKKICSEHKIPLIEDTAWGCGGKLGDKFLGTIGDIGCFSFDFAKTITTGEGGMVVFKDKDLWKKAKAWHDHGHENNPSFPRWEDTRASSGFNFRMMELQGAVGIAQLRKLTSIVDAQRANRDLIWAEIQKLGLKVVLREVPNNSYDTADALIFFVENSQIAIKCRNELLLVGLSTKILPEAISWHFAGEWGHIPQLSISAPLAKQFTKSREIIKKAVSIPITIKMEPDLPYKIALALERALNG